MEENHLEDLMKETSGAHPTKFLKIKIILTFSYFH